MTASLRKKKNEKHFFFLKNINNFNKYVWTKDRKDLIHQNLLTKIMVHGVNITKNKQHNRFNTENNNTYLFCTKSAYYNNFWRIIWHRRLNEWLLKT